jgi:hypothetical protein
MLYSSIRNHKKRNSQSERRVGSGHGIDRHRHRSFVNANVFAPQANTLLNRLRCFHLCVDGEPWMADRFCRHVGCRLGAIWPSGTRFACVRLGACRLARKPADLAASQSGSDSLWIDFAQKKTALLEGGLDVGACELVRKVTMPSSRFCDGEMRRHRYRGPTKSPTWLALGRFHQPHQ